jgi:hypothetical protein
VVWLATTNSKVSVRDSSWSDVLDVGFKGRQVAFPSFGLSRVIANHRLVGVAWFGLFCAIALAVQFAVSAYSVDLGNHADESAHFLNGLVLRDYLIDGLGTNPISFASNYYLHYPKIAPLVWPPLFHIALAVMLLPGWAPHTAALMLVALIAGATAHRLFRFANLITPGATARVLPLAFLLVPLITVAESVVMVDLAVAMTALEAAWWFNRYMAQQSLRNAALFGLWSAACCLTKGNGAAVVLVAPIAIVAGRKLALLKNRGLYVAAFTVAVLAGPFLYVSYKVCAAMGDFSAAGVGDLERRVGFFSNVLWTQLTPLPALLAALALIAIAVNGVTTSQVSDAERAGAPLTLSALALAVVSFHVFLPLGNLEGRYMVTGIAPLIALMPIGADVLTRRLSVSWKHAVSTSLLVLGAAGLATNEPSTLLPKSLGFRETVAALPDNSLAGVRFFIVSDASGEGAFVSEVAQRRPKPMATVIRASKFLIDEDWMGSNTRQLFGTAADTLNQLEELHVDYLVVDTSSAAKATPFWSHVQEVVAISNGALVRVVEVPSSDRVRRSIVTYRLVRHSPDPAKTFRANLKYFAGERSAEN